MQQHQTHKSYLEFGDAVKEVSQVILPQVPAALKVLDLDFILLSILCEHDLPALIGYASMQPRRQQQGNEETYLHHELDGDLRKHVAEMLEANLKVLPHEGGQQVEEGIEGVEIAVLLEALRALVHRLRDQRPKPLTVAPVKFELFAVVLSQVHTSVTARHSKETSETNK